MKVFLFFINTFRTLFCCFRTIPCVGHYNNLLEEDDFEDSSTDHECAADDAIRSSLACNKEDAAFYSNSHSANLQCKNLLITLPNELLSLIMTFVFEHHNGLAQTSRHFYTLSRSFHYGRLASFTSREHSLAVLSCKDFFSEDLRDHVAIEMIKHTEAEAKVTWIYAFLRFNERTPSRTLDVLLGKGPLAETKSEQLRSTMRNVLLNDDWLLYSLVSKSTNHTDELKALVGEGYSKAKLVCLARLLLTLDPVYMPVAKIVADSIDPSLWDIIAEFPSASISKIFKILDLLQSRGGAHRMLYEQIYVYKQDSFELGVAHYLAQQLSLPNIDYTCRMECSKEHIASFLFNESLCLKHQITVKQAVTELHVLETLQAVMDFAVSRADLSSAWTREVCKAFGEFCTEKEQSKCFEYQVLVMGSIEGFSDWLHLEPKQIYHLSSGMSPLRKMLSKEQVETVLRMTDNESLLPCIDDPVVIYSKAPQECKTYLRPFLTDKQFESVTEMAILSASFDEINLLYREKRNIVLEQLLKYVQAHADFDLEKASRDIFQTVFLLTDNGEFCERNQAKVSGRELEFALHIIYSHLSVKQAKAAEKRIETINSSQSQ